MTNKNKIMSLFLLLTVFLLVACGGEDTKTAMTKRLDKTKQH